MDEITTPTVKEIRLRSVPPTVHEELTNIADHLGITLESLLKPKLRDIANSYAPELRKPKPKV